MSEPDVSIVMPVRNSRPEELREAVESALGQTLRTIELVCVDDGSTDDTLSRLRAFAQRDGRVRIIGFESNKGTLAARNAAILAATGRYVLPLDPDDSIRPEACETLSGIMDRRSLDMLQFAVETSEAGECYRSLTNPAADEDMDPRAFAEDVFARKRRSWAVIVKMFRREPLAAAAASFPDGYCANGEDGLLLLKFLSAAGLVGSSPQALYIYRFGGGLSTSARPSREQAERIMRSLRYSIPWLDAQTSPLAETFRGEMLLKSLDALVRSRMGRDARAEAVRGLAKIVDTAEIAAALKSFAPLSEGARCFVSIKRALARRRGRRRKLLRKLALAARTDRMLAAAREHENGGAG